ncbi:MAG: SDR family NAD(P)-dependent oxidoreductase [Dermatophilus congolensis]|nr:SDR family NAD(P)-dependent oxidoreductase [Dermatophilus congolensis]
MKLSGISTAVTGGASGLGLATVKRLAAAGAKVTIIDLPKSPGAQVASEIDGDVVFAPADVTDRDSFDEALGVADERGGLRALVHCAGADRPMRVVDRDGNAGSVEAFEFVIRLNLVGSFNAMALGAARMAKHEPVDGERGVVIMTASVAAFEGQIGQINYAASKGGVVGMTICGARDLASKLIRVNTIAPGIMATPLLLQMRQDIQDSLAASVPNPARLGDPDEYGFLASHIIENGYINGETLRLDGAIRMAPR